MELEIRVEDLLNRKIESDRIEFKTGWNPDDIYHSVCAFANDYNNKGGGYIVVGVEEKEGIAIRTVKGVPENMLDKFKRQCIIHQIRNSTKFVSYKDIKKLMADLKRVYVMSVSITQSKCFAITYRENILGSF